MYIKEGEQNGWKLILIEYCVLVVNLNTLGNGKKTVEQMYTKETTISEFN